MRLSVLFDDQELKAIINKHENDAYERIGRLTKTQAEVLPYICSGLSNKLVAYELGMSQRTVENHRKALMDRTNCRTFAQLIRLCVLASVEI